VLHHLRAQAGRSVPNFICGWLQEESPFPEEFKPDRLGVLIIPVRWRRKPPTSCVRPAGPGRGAARVGCANSSLKTDRPVLYESSGERFRLRAEGSRWRCWPSSIAASACGRRAGGQSHPPASSLPRKIACRQGSRLPSGPPAPAIERPGFSSSDEAVGFCHRPPTQRRRYRAGRISI